MEEWGGGVRLVHEKVWRGKKAFSIVQTKINKYYQAK